MYTALQALEYQQLAQPPLPHFIALGFLGATGGFAKTIDKNAVHGSDSAENAKTEIAFFFRLNEIFSR